MLVRLLMHFHLDLYAFVDRLNHKMLLCHITNRLDDEKGLLRLLHLCILEACLIAKFQQLIHFGGHINRCIGDLDFIH